MGLLGRLGSGSVFWSALEEAIRNSQMKEAPAKQWLGTLTSTPGVKANELEWSGLKSQLTNAGDVKMSREEILDSARRGQRNYALDEIEMSEHGGKEQSYEDWYDDHSHIIDEREERLIDSWLEDNLDQILPHYQVDEFTPPPRDSAAVRAELDAALKQIEAMGLRHSPSDIPQEVLSRRDELANELAQLQAREARDPATPDLFTGAVDEMVDPEPRYRVRIRGGFHDLDEELDEVFESEREAERYADAALSNYYDDAEDSWRDDAQSNGRFRDEAVRDVEEDYPREEGEGGVQFSNHAIPGGDDYEETLLTLPKWKGDRFTDDHWSDYVDDQVVAHIRHDRRYLPNADGEDVPTLAVQEIQSDWHQKGRRQGFADPEDVPRLKEEYEKAVAAFDDARFRGVNDLSPFGTALDNARVALRRAQGGVPKAPFGSNAWADIAFRRMLRKAIDEGYDQFGWAINAHNGAVDDSPAFRKFYGDIIGKTAKKAIKPAQGTSKIHEAQDRRGFLWRLINISPELREAYKRGEMGHLFPMLLAMAGGGSALAGGGLLSRLDRRES